MKLQQGKWYVCIRNWSDDGWCKFYDGMLLRCNNDNEVKDVYNICHVFDEAEAGITFREATDTERNIASATEVNIDEFIKEEQPRFDSSDRLIDIYRCGAIDILRHIKSQMSIKGTED